MSILLGYVGNDRERRVHITEYDPVEHKGKIFCADGHHVIAKRGAKTVWHYSHQAGEACEASRVMGPWHHWWQDRVEPDFLEIIIKRDGKKHIADMINGDDVVVEFQKSVVSPDVIVEREGFYNKMIWVFYCAEHLMKVVKQVGRYQRLKMVGGSKFFLCSKKRAFLDFNGRGVLELLKVVNATKAKPELYVRIWTMEEFDKEFMNGCLKKTAPGRVDRMPYVFDDEIIEFEAAFKLLKAK